MLEKLNQIIKESEQAFATSELDDNAIADASNEATGVIVDVSKAQLDSGKADDLMFYFTGGESAYENLTKVMVNKYANRLNRYFNMSIAGARDLSEKVIPTVMHKFVKETLEDKTDKRVIVFLNWLSGNTVNFEKLFSRLRLQLS